MNIRNSIILNDLMSPVLNKVMTSLRSTLELMRSSSGGSILFRQTEQEIQNAQEALDRFNLKLQQTKSSLNITPTSPALPPMQTSGSIAGTFSMTDIWATTQLIRDGFNAIKSVTDFGDTFLLTNARINNMNQGLMQTAEIQQLIYESAQRSRAEYTATANAVTRMGILAGAAFKDANGKLNTNELIKFNELVNKSFVVGGSTPIEQKSALYQLTQAMASGRLQGDEMRTIREAAPLLREAIRNYMDVDETTFKEMQRNGEITAEIIKNAVFSSEKSIENAFSNMEMTAAQSMIVVQNAMTKTFQQVGMSISSGVVSTAQFVMRNIETIGTLLLYVGTVSALIFGRNLVMALVMALPMIYSAATGFLAMNFYIVAGTLAVFALLRVLLKFPEILANIMGSIYAFGAGYINVIKLVLNYWISGINIIIEHVNKLLQLVSEAKISKIGKFEYDSVSGNFELGYSKGYQIVNNLNKKIDDFVNPLKSAFSFTAPKTTNSSSLMSNLVPNNIDSVGSVGDIKGGKISLDEDSIKWLNEEGAIEFVNRYTTMRPVLRVQFGDVHEEADVDNIVDKLTNMLEDAYKTSLEN